MRARTWFPDVHARPSGCRLSSRLAGFPRSNGSRNQSLAITMVSYPFLRPYCRVNPTSGNLPGITFAPLSLPRRRFTTLAPWVWVYGERTNRGRQKANGLRSEPQRADVAQRALDAGESQLGRTGCAGRGAAPRALEACSCIGDEDGRVKSRGTACFWKLLSRPRRGTGTDPSAGVTRAFNGQGRPCSGPCVTRSTNVAEHRP